MPRTVAWVLKHPRAICKRGRGQWNGSGDKWEKDFQSIKKEKSQRITALRTQLDHSLRCLDFPRGWVESGQDGVDKHKCGMGASSRKGKRGQEACAPNAFYARHFNGHINILCHTYTFKIKNSCGRWVGVSRGERTKEKVFVSLLLILSPLCCQNSVSWILRPQLADSNVIH